MEPDQLLPTHWYWVRREDGSLAPYRLHRVVEDGADGRLVGEFFVGSFIRIFPLGSVVGEALMPESEAQA